MSNLTKGLDPRVKRTRTLLQQAFLDLMREKSYSTITVQDITERATVNRATFYAHFEDKYALLNALVHSRFQQMLSERLPGDFKWERHSLQVLIHIIFEFLGEVQRRWEEGNRPFEPLVARAAQQELYELLLRGIKQRKASGDPHNDPETAATVASWAIFGAAVEWSRGERHLPIEQVCEHVLTVITLGIAL
ncbi:hypothetical protein KSD_63570 [Ktedonobacter sp. SOSP1-85]|uniref:TetR/AcrR family transcriptional regulator n=1 Tax=Ktedonobacter sp. SOSP1-85 TaxID=2778367 RepID=UPI00191591A3|nr:TetR/AcrR family transcriptional regulator [Ktedonobacter sp. SOSP1-85]GHO78586.1 hypothetical protein KSD_63570 [Ktedonobacter sp. SOSP1-85]